MSKYVRESPQEKQNRKNFQNFSKALTGSVASRLARRDQKSSMSSIRTDHYMREADGYIKSRQAKVAKCQQPLPPRFRTLLALQITGGEEKGQWHKSPELMKLLGGYVPDPPKGIEEWRWWTALGMAFIRRHPHLWKNTRSAYELAEYWVTDIWLLRTARDMLPPLDGTFKDFIGRQGKNEIHPEIAAKIRGGQWRQPVTGALENRGYMAFTWDMKGRSIRDTNTLAHAVPGADEHDQKGHREELTTANDAGGERRRRRRRREKDGGSGSPGSNSGSPGSDPGSPPRGFTAEAAQKMEESIRKQGNKVGRTWKTNDEINEIARVKEHQLRLKNEMNNQAKALNKEFEKYMSRPGKDFRLNDPVSTRWRASSEWDQGRVHKQWWSAIVKKVYSDGTVDIIMNDGRKDER